MDYVKTFAVTDFGVNRSKCYKYLGKVIAIIKNQDGSFYAIEGQCKHQMSPLLDKPLSSKSGDLVVCPRHGWKYNIKTGECLTEAWARLYQYPLKIENGYIYVLPQVIPDDDDWID